MIDWIILTLMFWVVGFVMAVFVYVVVGNSDMADALAGLVVVTAVFVIHWIYFALQESSAKQATFGKRAMKIIVTEEQGQRLTFGRASGRAFARLLSGMFFSVGYIIAALTARKQALHDLIANTLVLRK